MLAIRGTNSNKKALRGTVTAAAVLLLLGGLYLLTLVSAPAIAPVIAQKPIVVTELPKPTAAENRIVIPKLGVNIPYAPAEASLDRGAEWRHPTRGNPVDGGNFIIAAHRFSIQPTPQGTIEKSPFYRIDKLAIGDEIIIDYQGKRYGYKISQLIDVKPTQVEIEAPSTDAKITLYSCDLGGAQSGRIVVIAEPLGEVTIKQLDTETSI